MADKTLDDLKAVLFQTLDDLRDKNNSMDLDRAKAINEVGQTIINLAKTEVYMFKASGGMTRLSMVRKYDMSTHKVTHAKPEELPNGILGRSTHKLSG